MILETARWAGTLMSGQIHQEHFGHCNDIGIGSSGPAVTGRINRPAHGCNLTGKHIASARLLFAQQPSCNQAGSPRPQEIGIGDDLYPKTVVRHHEST